MSAVTSSPRSSTGKDKEHPNFLLLSSLGAGAMLPDLYHRVGGRWKLVKATTKRTETQLADEEEQGTTNTNTCSLAAEASGSLREWLNDGLAPELQIRPDLLFDSDFPSTFFNKLGLRDHHEDDGPAWFATIQVSQVILPLQKRPQFEFLHETTVPIRAHKVGNGLEFVNTDGTVIPVPINYYVAFVENDAAKELGRLPVPPAGQIKVSVSMQPDGHSDTDAPIFSSSMPYSLKGMEQRSDSVLRQLSFVPPGFTNSFTAPSRPALWCAVQMGVEKAGDQESESKGVGGNIVTSLTGMKLVFGVREDRARATGPKEFTAVDHGHCRAPMESLCNLMEWKERSRIEGICEMVRHKNTIRRRVGLKELRCVVQQMRTAARKTGSSDRRGRVDGREPLYRLGVRIFEEEPSPFDDSSDDSSDKSSDDSSDNSDNYSGDSSDEDSDEDSGDDSNDGGNKGRPDGDGGTEANGGDPEWRRIRKMLNPNGSDLFPSPVPVAPVATSSSAGPKPASGSDADAAGKQAVFQFLLSTGGQMPRVEIVPDDSSAESSYSAVSAGLAENRVPFGLPCRSTRRSNFRAERTRGRSLSQETLDRGRQSGSASRARSSTPDRRYPSPRPSGGRRTSPTALAVPVDRWVARLKREG